MSNFWEHESQTEYSFRTSGRFRRKVTQSAFRRFARSSLQQRGHDPDMITSLGSDISLTSGEMGEMVPGRAAQLRRMQDQLKRIGGVAEMTQRELGARAQALGAGVGQYVTATPQERGAAASLVGEDYLRRQEQLEGYSPEQVDVWTRVSRRGEKLLAETGLRGPHMEDGMEVKDPGYDEALAEAYKEAVGSLSWEEKGIISPNKGFFEGRLSELGGFMAWIEEQDPMLAGPLARTVEDGFPAYDPEGMTGFERGAELSRPVAQDLLEGQAMRFEMLEEGFEDITGVRTRVLSDAHRSQITEDILTEVINPAALVLVAPIAMQGTAGLRGGALANKMASNLLGTGMEPELVGGTLRGITVIRTRGLQALSTVPRNVRNTRVFQAVLHGEAGSARMGEEVFTSYRGKGGMGRATEGEGLYVTTDRSLAEFFTEGPEGATQVQEVHHFAPRNPLIVSDEPLYLLKEDTRILQPARPGDSVWTRLNKEAASDVGLTRANWESKARGMPAALTRRARAEGYDAISVRSGKGQWQVLIDSKLITGPVQGGGAERSGLLVQAETAFTAAKQSVADALRDSNAYRTAVKAGEIPQQHLDEGLRLLGQRRKEFVKARKALNAARIEDERAAVTASVRAHGGDDRLADLVGSASEQSALREVAEEVLLNAKTWRQKMAAAVGVITGTPPGVVGRLANRRDILLGGLRRYTSEAVGPIFADVQKLLNKELPHITYTGETKWASEAMGTYKAYHVVQHPEMFDGLSFALKRKLAEAQTAMRTRLEAAKAMGYPIEALDGAYLEQLWEIPKSHLTVGDVPLPGRVSVAKPRLFDDYLRGLSQGYVPKEMTVEELMHHSSGLLDQAVSDAWMRQEVLRRFGKVGGATAGTGRAPFRHVLYKGWSGPEDITNWVSKLDAPVGSNIRGIGNLSAAFRGTVFGLADIAVTGVQWPLSIAHGGFQAGLGTLTRSLELAGIDLFHVYAKDTALVSRLADGAEHGLHVLIGPSSVSLKGGTIVKYAPKVGRTLDKPISKAIDKLAQWQFGDALTFVRLRMYEGNLILLKLTGKNIDDPAVRRVAAEWANSCTGASRGPMTKGRRAIESISLTSVQMTRANLSVYGQLISQLSPKAGRMERLRAAVTIANLGAYTYGVQYLFNSAFGDGPQEWIPGRPDWATIRIKGTTVPIMPQRSILRAMDKSIRIIEDYAKGEPDADIWDIAQAWSQVAVGKASPLVGIPLALVGIGFEPETGQFHVGGLSRKGQVMSALPVPPLAEQAAFQEHDILSLTTAGLGFNPYNTPAGRLLREEFNRAAGEDLNWESPAHSAMVESNPKLNKLWEKSREESREYGSQSAITSYEIGQQIEQGEDDQGIVRLAEAVKSGDPFAAQRWSDARSSFLGWRGGKWDGRFTARDPKTEIGVLVDEYYSIDPKDPKFTTASGVTDWGAFNEARDIVLAKMPLADADAIRDKEKFISPVAEAVDKEFRAAQDSLRPLWDLEGEVWKNLQEKYPDFQQYTNVADFKDAKAQELARNGVSQEDLAWRLERLPVVSKIGELIQTVRFQYRLQNPKVDALWVKWYGGTPARAQERAKVPSGSFRRPRS